MGGKEALPGHHPVPRGAGGRWTFSPGPVGYPPHQCSCAPSARMVRPGLLFLGEWQSDFTLVRTEESGKASDGRWMPARKPIEAAGVLPGLGLASAVGGEGPGGPWPCCLISAAWDQRPSERTRGPRRDAAGGWAGLFGGQVRSLAWRGAKQVPLSPARTLPEGQSRAGKGWAQPRPRRPQAWAAKPKRGRLPLSSVFGRKKGGKRPQRCRPPRPDSQTLPPGAWRATPCLGTKLPGGRAAGTPGTACQRVARSRKPRGPSRRLPARGLRPPGDTRNETVFSFLCRDSRSWNLQPLGFAIFTHPEPSGLHGDASKQQIPGGNDVTFPFPAAQASSHRRGARAAAALDTSRLPGPSAAGPGAAVPLPGLPATRPSSLRGLLGPGGWTSHQKQGTAGATQAGAPGGPVARCVTAARDVWSPP